MDVMKLRTGTHRRWFWRIRLRYGKKWWAYPDDFVSRELRMMSWRRAL